MPVTLDQAIQIYAQASRTWFGKTARTKTQERIDYLARGGDVEGVAVWKQVKRTIEVLEKRSGAPG